MTYPIDYDPESIGYWQRKNHQRCGYLGTGDNCQERNQKSKKQRTRCPQENTGWIKIEQKKKGLIN